MIEQTAFLSNVLTASDVLAALRRRHEGHWLFLAEVRYGTGYTYRSDTSIDTWAMHCWPSEHYTRVAYEIKVNRGDFLRELKQPQKRRCALLVSNRFYFAAPHDLIRPDELPPEAGLVEVWPDGVAHVAVEAMWRDTPPPTWAFMASVARQCERGGRG